jgi:hypothetical protein
MRLPTIYENDTYKINYEYENRLNNIRHNMILLMTMIDFIENHEATINKPNYDINQYEPPEPPPNYAQPIEHIQYNYFMSRINKMKSLAINYLK